MKKDSVCRKIRKLRVSKGISQEYMAGELGITQPSYARLEFEDKRLNIDRIKIISKILDTNLAELLTEEINKSKDKPVDKNSTQIKAIINIDKEYIESLKNEINFLRELLKSRLL
jgi:transcriptional regulator with XRE-family HTH domain